MKEFWLKKEACTGCGACINICPVNAVSMKTDSCGFSYPVIKENCIHCNLCEKVCRSRLNLDIRRLEQPQVFAAWSLDKEIRYHSTSGGMFSEIAKAVLQQNGLVAGAGYNKNNLVEHILIQKETELEIIRQSKYIQSDTSLIYQEIKEKLLEGKKVLFCGAPCQAAGLYAYLGKDMPGLITADFICRGMNSPKAYLAWLDELEKKQKSKAVKVWFKYKINGWKKSPLCTRIDFKNGTSCIQNGAENTFMSGYLGPNLYIRPCCGKCEFKGIPRQGDITLADFWGIDKALDDDGGTSLVLLNSQKGKEIFGQIRDRIFTQERKVDEIIQGNDCFSNSVKINPRSTAFLENLDTIVFSKALKKYTHHTLFGKVYKKIKSRKTN